MITATLFLVFAVITILGMPIALALVGGGMAAIVAGDLMPLFTSCLLYKSDAAAE